jgi:hypothetical protein
MLLFVGAVDEDVIKIYYHKLSDEWKESLVHYPHESTMGIR